ncbi:MAG: flagellar basal body-associated FliL family protein [Alphaproteobacteria bacterium]|jgi:flagellar FliL protein|nr:flagellar basal body-associated FliL family protein [Alphaproteobacteria bacterium]
MAKAKKEETEKKDAEEGEAKPEGAAEGAAEGAPAEGAPAEGGGKKKLLIIIGGVVVLLIGAGAGLYFTGMLDSLLGKEAPVECAEGDHECEEAAKAAAEHGEDAKGGHGEKKDAKKGDHGAAKGGHGEAGGASDSFVAIPTMIVNLNSDDGTPRYLRLTVQLELEDAADKGAVEAIIPKVIDQFQTYLRELRVRDLRGSGGIYRLQMELLWRVNQAAAPVEVKDVLFQEILIQ